MSKILASGRQNRPHVHAIPISYGQLRIKINKPIYQVGASRTLWLVDIFNGTQYQPRLIDLSIIVRVYRLRCESCDYKIQFDQRWLSSSPPPRPTYSHRFFTWNISHKQRLIKGIVIWSHSSTTMFLSWRDGEINKHMEKRTDELITPLGSVLVWERGELPLAFFSTTSKKTEKGLFYKVYTLN